MTVEHAHEVWTHNRWTVQQLNGNPRLSWGSSLIGDPILRHPCRSNVCDTGRVLDDQWEPTDDI